VVDDNQKVMSVGLYLKSRQMGSEELTHVQMNTYPSLRWESLNSKGLTVSAWEYLILYAKFMEFHAKGDKRESARFRRCSNKREYRSDMELVNLINLR